MLSPKMKTLFRLSLLCAAIVSINEAHVLTKAQSSKEERKFKTREFVDMPVRLRNVKNLQSDNWPKELEIEIENISKRTIYFINAYLLFPDDPVPDGMSGVNLQFGNIENMDAARLAKPEDEHLSPGELVTLTIGEMYRNGLAAKQKHSPQNLMRVEFEIEIISFGDGTGFEGGQFLDLRKKKP